MFHLQGPVPGPALRAHVPDSAPVPPAKDTGSNYQLHSMSTGPYKFQSYQLNKQLTLVPNPQWNAAMIPTSSSSRARSS